LRNNHSFLNKTHKQNKNTTRIHDTSRGGKSDPKMQETVGTGRTEKTNILEKKCEQKNGLYYKQKLVESHPVQGKMRGGKRKKCKLK